jgi:hypothetical protein
VEATNFASLGITRAEDAWQIKIVAYKKNAEDHDFIFNSIPLNEGKINMFLNSARYTEVMKSSVSLEFRE